MSYHSSSSSSGSSSGSSSSSSSSSTDYAPRVYKETEIKGKKPDADEPTRIVEGVVEVGAIDLKSTLDANSAQSSDTTHRDYQKEKPQRNRFSANNPHLNSPYSPLETLVLQSLRRYGDMHPGTVDGEVMMMFVEFANLIIEDLRGHPYWDNPEIDYYTHPSEIRDIPDNIMVAGLLYHYSVQQHHRHRTNTAAGTGDKDLSTIRSHPVFLEPHD